MKEQLSKAGVLDPDYIIYKQGGIDKFTFDKDNNLLKSMSTAGQLYAREMFPSSKNTRLIYDIYKSVLAPL